MQGPIVYALKRFIFLTGLIILMQNEVDKPTPGAPKDGIFPNASEVSEKYHSVLGKPV